MNKTHHIDGVPTPADKYLELKSTIEKNIIKKDASNLQEGTRDVNAYRMQITEAELNDNIFYKNLLHALVLFKIHTNKEVRSFPFNFLYSNLAFYSINGNSEINDITINIEIEVRVRSIMSLTTSDKARFLYDGNDKAILYINQDDARIFSNIGIWAREILYKSDEVMIIERRNDSSIFRKYKVPVRIMKDITSILNDYSF